MIRTEYSTERSTKYPNRCSQVTTRGALVPFSWYSAGRVHVSQAFNHSTEHEPVGEAAGRKQRTLVSHVSCVALGKQNKMKQVAEGEAAEKANADARAAKERTTARDQQQQLREFQVRCQTPRRIFAAETCAC